MKKRRLAALFSLIFVTQSSVFCERCRAGFMLGYSLTEAKQIWGGIIPYSRF